MPPSCTATAITCVMKPEVAASGPRPVCSTHGASSPCARSDANVCSSQSRLVCSSSPANAAKPLAPEAPQRLRAEPEPGRRPELGAEHAEREVGVREEALEHAGPLGAELVRVRLGGAQEERRFAVGVRGRGRQLGVEVLETARRELVAELRVRRAADPERVPRAEDVVQEPGLRQLRGLDRAAEPVVPLEHAHAPAPAREQRAARERVDAAADDDRVVVSHPRASGTRRR